MLLEILVYHKYLEVLTIQIIHQYKYIYYKIQENSADYIFNVDDQAGTLKISAESTIRRAIANRQVKCKQHAPHLMVIIKHLENLQLIRRK